MIHARKFRVECELHKDNHIMSLKVMHQWKRHPIQRILKSKNDFLYKLFIVNRKNLWLRFVILVSLLVWNILEMTNTQNGEDDAKKEKTAVPEILFELFNVIIIFACSFIILPVMAYLEMQLLSFFFEKFKSRMTIDDEDDQYLPLQQINDMEDFV